VQKRRRGTEAGRASKSGNRTDRRRTKEIRACCEHDTGLPDAGEAGVEQCVGRARRREEGRLESERNYHFDARLACAGYRTLWSLPLLRIARYRLGIRSAGHDRWGRVEKRGDMTVAKIT
jgi:hypothetical protein